MYYLKVFQENYMNALFFAQMYLTTSTSYIILRNSRVRWTYSRVLSTD